MNVFEEKRLPVLGVPISAVTWDETTARIQHWAEHKSSRYICVCNVHSVATASEDKQFGELVRNADLAVPDGAPVAWMLRRLGAVDQERINGPDLMLRYCASAAVRGESIFLFGSTTETLVALERRLRDRFPRLEIAGSYAPPFRPMTPDEDASVVELIKNSDARTVWVSLGCPKQERWMAEHRGRIDAVMIGVGAAFDYHSGTLKRAPVWMQHAGLEWVHRLASEPRRLWRRYLQTNSLFVRKAASQLFLGR